MWVREEANGNVCLGNREAVQDRVGKFLAVLTGRKDEVRRRCGTVLQSRAGALLRGTPARFPASGQMHHPTLALVYVRSSGGLWQFIKEQGARKQHPIGTDDFGLFPSVGSGSTAAVRLDDAWRRVLGGAYSQHTAFLAVGRMLMLYPVAECSRVWGCHTYNWSQSTFAHLATLLAWPGLSMRK